MTQPELRSCVELVAAASIPVAIAGVIAQRIFQAVSIGVRAIQFLAVAVIIPTILILALEGILGKGAVGALIGALGGYLFANISRYDESRSARPNTPKADKR